MSIASPTELHINQTEEEFAKRLNKSNKTEEQEELLGDLLFFLRQNKLMSTLMICRQIEKILVTNGMAELVANKADISDLDKNEKHKIELDKFFGERGLGFKVKELVKNKTSADVLREFFGDKLIIE